MSGVTAGKFEEGWVRDVEERGGFLLRTCPDGHHEAYHDGDWGDIVINERPIPPRVWTLVD